MLTLTTWVRIQTCEICHCCYVKNGVKITVKNSINKDQQYIYIYLHDSGSQKNSCIRSTALDNNNI